MDAILTAAINAALIGYAKLRADPKKLELISKGGVDAATPLDYQLEDETRSYLRASTGKHVFGEERGGDRNAEWIIDKIDGTPNFKSGLDMFGSAVTHLCGDSADITVVVLPKKEELYLAVKQKGTYIIHLPEGFDPTAYATIRWDLENKHLETDALKISGMRLIATPEIDPKKLQIAADIGYKDRGQKLNKVAAYASEVFYAPLFGSASYSLCQVAAGKLGGYVIFDVDMNDVFSGQLLVEEAGGITSDSRGRPVTRTTRTLVAAANKSGSVSK
ncbi:hypothetical protein HZB02_05165 [Candidatus Woesearchaeota archaeon]|nr:hypothetical protein [Candidatus Woesearchaeota archaeon]